MVFSVFWKAIEQKLNEAAEKKAAAPAKKGGKTGSMTLATLPALTRTSKPASSTRGREHQHY